MASILFNSSAVNSGFFKAAMLLSICSTFSAPTNTDDTLPLRKTHAIAIWASDCPRSIAISFNFLALATRSSVMPISASAGCPVGRDTF